MANLGRVFQGVEVLDEEWTCTPVIFQEVGWCLTLTATALLRGSVEIAVICSSAWRGSIVVARRTPGLRRNREPCDRLTDCLRRATFAHGQVVAAPLLPAAQGHHQSTGAHQEKDGDGGADTDEQARGRRLARLGPVSRRSR